MRLPRDRGTGETSAEEPTVELDRGSVPREDPEGSSSPPASRAPSASGALSLAEGIELVGKFEGSGYKEDPYIARRADGQVIQLTYLLFLVAEAIQDQGGDYRAVAGPVSERFGRTVSADNVRFLIEKKLRPLGVVANADGSEPSVKKAAPFLALRFRQVLLPERAVNVVAAALKPLFFPPVILAVLAALVAFDVWYFGVHGISDGIRGLLYKPLWVLLIYGLLLVSIMWHELGHAAGCKYGGARPGVIGFGIYLVWPAFYNDVTDAYRLGKGGRVRTDLGGVYFNAIFILITGGAYALTGLEPLLVVVLLQHLLIAYQFVPFLRLDGYFVISDLTGVPDLFARVKPTLKGMIPGRSEEEAADELKPWVRWVVRGWVALMVPILLFLFANMVLSLPRIFATGWDSFWQQEDRLSEQLAKDRYAQGAVSGFQMAFLVLPLLGVAITTSRVGKRIGAGLMSVTDGRPVFRGLGIVILASAVAFGAFILWPNGDYREIEPGERWTVASSVEALSESATGRPSVSEATGVTETAPTGSSEQGSGSSSSEGSGDQDPGTEEDGTQTEEEPAAESSPTPTPEPEPTASPSPSP